MVTKSSNKDLQWQPRGLLLRWFTIRTKRFNELGVDVKEVLRPKAKRRTSTKE